MKYPNSRLIAYAVSVVLFIGFWAKPIPAGPSSRSVVLKAMEDELKRSMKGLGEKGSPPPYFISYEITDTESAYVTASFGALRASAANRWRLLDVDVRVGDYQMDSTRRIQGDRFSRFDFDFHSTPIAIEDDPAAIRAALWLETDRRYNSAIEKLIQVKTNSEVKVKKEDESADFSREGPNESVTAPAQLKIDMTAWEKRIKALSARFSEAPYIYEGWVSLQAGAATSYFVNSEGTTIQQPDNHWRIAVYASTKADDGMDLYRYEAFDAHSPDRLPSDDTVRGAIDRVVKDLAGLRAAPAIEPYTGPAILSGRAAGVFFHEIFGHRIEGHRQKDDDEGQTFTKKVNQSILPDFISVFDDPTQKEAAGADLNGYYLYDNEGVKARRVAVAEKGVLKNFLMSRSPAAGFDKSNGHGRKQPGLRAVGRQGNLIVEASRTVSEQRLRELLIEECKKQGKSFGLLFMDISGGFTFTGRGIPQSFAVSPIMVYRVYVDGRPDELVRGVDLIGTPLISFSKIIACGDKQEVFNGYCGAESGTVPVSAVAPSVLTTQIEIQKKQKSAERPPLLPPPPGNKEH